MLTFGSVCSGIEAASVAWESIGFTPLWFSEIDNFPSAVLKYHWPNVENLGDMTKIHEKISGGDTLPPDILVGGTPCQSFSIAGCREGLNDSRGQLSLSFIKLADVIDEKRKSKNENESIIVWENVPGVLSSSDNAFGQFLGRLAGEQNELFPSGNRWSNAGFVSGPSRRIAWRILDSQYFGVPQRRRRLFVVASARDNVDPSKILFESTSVRGNTQTRRKTKNTAPRSAAASLASGRAVTGPILANCGKKQWLGNQEVFSGDYRIIEKNSDVFFISNRIINRSVFSGGNGQGFKTNICYTLDTCSQPHSVLYSRLARDYRVHNNLCPTLTANTGTGGNNMPNTISLGRVRRLTPLECERLQGFPDNFTQIPYRKKSADDCPDSPRYQAIGNSMTVPVMRWIGIRIKNHLLGVDKS